MLVIGNMIESGVAVRFFIERFEADRVVNSLRPLPVRTHLTRLVVHHPALIAVPLPHEIIATGFDELPDRVLSTQRKHDIAAIAQSTVEI